MTTLDLSDRHNVLAVQKALAGDSESLWMLEKDRVIRVSDLIAFYAEQEDEETGQVQGKAMLALLGPDGTFHTGSKFAFRDMQRIAYLHGRPPWRPPVLLMPIRVTGRNGHTRQSILLAE